MIYNLKTDHTSNHRVEIVCKIILVIEEELFHDMDWTDGDTFPTKLSKRANNRANQ